MRPFRVPALMLGALLLTACATGRAPTDARVVDTLSPHTGYRGGEPLARESLPADALVAQSDAPLHLLAEVRGERIVSLRAVAAQEANLTLAFVQSERARSSIDIKSTLPIGLKLDLFVSRDGQTFAYTSSCPVQPGGNAFAQWPHRVQAVAIANPRAGDGEICD